MRRSASYYILAALSAAALSGRPAAGEPAGPLEPPSMPELAGISELSGEAAENPEAMNAYQAGVQAYLNGKDDDAVASLREALRIDPGNEKAERLLLKVLLRGINDNYAAGNYRKARIYVQEARKRFPSNPEIKLLYSSIQERGAAPREEKAAPGTGTEPETSGAGNADRRKAPRRAAPRPAQTPPAGQDLAPDKPPAAAGERPKASPRRFPPLNEHLPELGGALLSALLLLFFYLRQSQQKALLLQVENLQKALTASQKE
ncbi:MAG: hypothetical protein PHV33_14540, partial [Elusimicrobiales bacterium]|nr:hypothetical protein [Elusimicrobiales bacterium]